MTYKTKNTAGRIGRKLRLALATGWVLFASAASAASGYITTNETALDGIFSQATFGSSSIDIRFNAALSFNAGALTDLSSASEWTQLSALANPDPTVVSMFFVDTISYCNNTGSFVGCAAVAGHVLALNSSYAANAYGPTLLGHELGHNLGLPHYDLGGNLMNSTLVFNSLLLPEQVATILASPLIHVDAQGQRYISITPIAILAAAAVPEPGTWLLMASGLSGLLLLRRSRLKG